MAEAQNAALVFTHGWETLAHDLAMLRAAARRHLLVSALLGLLLGSWIFSATLDRPLEDVADYAAATLRVYAHPGQLLAKIDPSRGRGLEEADALRSDWQAYFGDRTFLFLGWQWLGRVATSGGVAFVVGTSVVIAHGRRRRRTRQRRGVTLRDPRAEALAEARGRRARVVLGAAVLVILAEAVRLWGFALAALPDYLTSAAAVSSAFVARALSPEGEGARVWFQGGLAPGFYAPAAVYEYLCPVYGVSVKVLAVGLFGKVCLTAAVLLAVNAVAVGRAEARREARGGYTIAGVPIPPGQECCHLLITGSPGSGKSTAIKDLLDQVRARGQRAIVYDRSGEYVKLYFRKGKDKLLNPLDRRSAYWTLWAEVRDAADYASIAKSLFPPGGHEPFWADASSVLFASAAAALARQASHRSDARLNRTLYKFLTSGALEELHRFLKDEPAARFLDPKAGAMPSNLIATITSRLEPWAHLPDLTDGSAPFSIRDFIERETDDSWLFLSTHEQHASLMKPLLSLWADIAVKAILSLPESTRVRLWCVLDEVASLQRLPALPDLLERGRKYGAAAVLGLQAITQLREAYGRDAAAGLTTQSSTWLVLRSIEPENCQWLENALGHAEVEEAQESISMGANAQRDGVGLQHRTVQRAVVLGSEISSLPTHHGFLRFAGAPHVYRVAYAHKDRKTITDPFAPRDRADVASAEAPRSE